MRKKNCLWEYFVWAEFGCCPRRWSHLLKQQQDRESVFTGVPSRTLKTPTIPFIDQMSCPVWIKNNLNHYKEKQTCVVQRLNVRWLPTKMTDHSSATSFLEFSILFPLDLDLHTVSKWLTDRSAFMAKFTNPYQFWTWREPSLLVYKILFAFLSFPKCRACWSTKPLAL